MIKAAVQTFTDCKSTSEYIERCERILNGFPERLECYIRLDVSHFVKNVMKNEAFKKMHPLQRQFYQCVIGVMIQCDPFEKLKEIVENVLIVATMPYECEDLPTEQSIRTLKKLIKTHDFSSALNEIESMDFQHKLNDIEDLSEEAIDWFQQIEQNIKNRCTYQPDETSSNIKDNLYMSDDFVSYFKILCKRIPLWTSVMNDYFQSDKKIATSSDVESENNIMKNIIFNDVQLPVRLDTFLMKFIRSIKGSIYTAVSCQKVSIIS